jgi:protoporphyrinogen oxidase
MKREKTSPRDPDLASDSARVVVLGAGPGGLAAAHALTRHGLRPLVIEKGKLPGGIARTEEYQGYCFDLGGHRFFTKIEAVDRIWRKMLGPDLIKVRRLSRIYYKERFFHYPLAFKNALLNLGVIESTRILLSYLRSRIRPYPEETTFEQWVSNRFGERLYRTFFKTYTEKVWGIPCHELQADWAAQRIKGLSLAAAVANALFGRQKAKSLIDEFDYPRKGPGMMWNRFQEVIEAVGGTVRMETEAVRLRHEHGRLTHVVLQDGAQEETLAVDQLISSIPVTRLVQLLDPAPPAEVLETARKFSYRSFLIVGLIVDRPHLFEDQWIYIHSPDVLVGRIQNFRNWSAAMVPDPDRTGIGMEYFCTAGDAFWKRPDEELIALAGQELARLGLAREEEVRDGFVVRQPFAYPVYDAGYQDRLAILRNYLATFENMQTIGRAGMHRYNNMDHSMYTGMLAAENVMGATHDIWQVNAEEEYLEEDWKPAVAPELAAQVLRRTFARMDKLALATAIGSVAGLMAFLATLWLVVKGGESVGANLQLLGEYFVGYTVTVQGAFIALAYSFGWGFLLGWLFAYLRNLLVAYHAYRLRRKVETLSVLDFIDQI